MTKPIIKIRFQNGLEFESFKKEVFDIEGLTSIYQFEGGHDPDFIIFGPYGNDIPPPGNYVRIGYFCENIRPDMTICEWAFGIPTEGDINNPHYKRIQWHDLDPKVLIKPADYDARDIAAGKKRFCNFLYSHQVPYREEFFRQLSRYKKVDAPGKSMNNMQSIDELYTGNVWERKRQFLSEYKFTIAFENYAYPGYQTEKLYDAMQTNSLPVYCGDPLVGRVFNTASFLNTADYVKPHNTTTVRWLENYCQRDFEDIRPAYFKSPIHRIKRKLKETGQRIKMNLQFRNLDFSPLIEKIIELDQDEDKYINMLKQPWLNHNEVPADSSTVARWKEIFDNSSKRTTKGK